MANSRPALAWLYGRHSTRNQGMTEHTQRKKCMDYYVQNLQDKGVLLAHSRVGEATAEAIGCPWENEAWFYDAATSGGTIFSERTYGAEIYHNCKKGDYLIVSSLDRLFRDKVDGFKTLDQLERKGVKRIVLDLPDFSGIQDAVLVDMIESNMVFYAHIFRRMVSRKMIDDNSHKRNAGVPYTFVAPIGWKIIGEGANRQYRIDKAERRYCDKIADLHDGGMTFAQIARWCMRKDTVRDYKPKQGRQFTEDKQARWAYRARLLDYPMVTSLRRFMEHWKEHCVAT